VQYEWVANGTEQYQVQLEISPGVGLSLNRALQGTNCMIPPINSILPANTPASAVLWGQKVGGANPSGTIVSYVFQLTLIPVAA
jgi:hypothetical protein